MAVTFNPLTPWQWAITLLGATGVLVLLGRYVFSSPAGRRRLFGNKTLLQVFVPIFSIGAVFFYALAAWNPIILKVKPGARPHLAVVLDVSQSVLSGDGGLESLKDTVVRWLNPSLASLEPELRSEATASIITVGMSGSEVRRSLPLSELASAINRLGERDLPDGSGTNLEEGLRLAKKQITDASGQGAVLLISDGNQTSHDAVAAAQSLARAGIPIYSLPLVGTSSAVYLAAADLPAQVAAQQETHLRWVVWNKLQDAAQVEFTVSINPGSQEPGGRAERVVRKSTVTMPGNQWANFNVPLTFQSAGFQFVDLIMKVQAGQEENIVQRRFFIYVLEPPRVLAIGGDNRWVGFYTQDEILIDHAEAVNLSSETIFDEYDSIVINNVDSRAFADNLLGRLAKSVTKDGLGLFFVNGPHAPRSEEEPTLLNSYEGTPIEPLLPVSVKPRDETQEPPPRNVVFLMDVSGSMEGAPLETSKQIARHLVQQYLRPQDRLDVITFTTEAEHVVQSLAMDADGRQQALQAIDNIPVGGGTDPTRALELLTSLKVANCGLIFLSDGEFAPVASRPDCRAAVFDIGQVGADPNFPLDIADPLPVPIGFNPASIVVPYFEPQVRKKFFEPGGFTPLSLRSSNPLAASLAFPEDLRLEGSAVSYIKETADLLAVRPKLTDPVLAFLETEEGTVGAFTSEFSDQWLQSPNGRAAIRDWILHTVAYSARDRYIFQLNDLGTGLEMCVSVNSEGLAPAQISGLQVALNLQGQEVPFRMVEDEAPGYFCGRTVLPERISTMKGTISIKESGLDAIPKKQRIPILLPASGMESSNTPNEAFSFGTNEALLKQLALEGRGIFDPAPGTVLFAPRTEQTRANPLWPWLLVVGTAFYLAAIISRRINN